MLRVERLVFLTKGLIMDNLFVVGGLLAAVAVVASFLFYAVYGGSRTSLANAVEGQVFNFTYEQPLHGTHERFLAKVIGKQTLTADQIRKLNSRSRYRANDPNFIRTNHLVTCRTFDGKVRNFYAERVTNCRKPLLAGTLFTSKVASLLF